MKRITSILLALVMVLSLMTIGVVTGHAEIVDSGSCGDNVTYTLDSDGVLTISGTGTIRDRAFINNTNIQCVVIEDGVTSIGKSAFNKCSSLTSVTIPDSVTSIGNNAFESCTKLVNINISDSVITIGRQTFRFCTSLASVDIPDSVTTIGNQAFSGCTSLASVDIPDSVASIGNNVFEDCTGLTSVTIGNSVTSINEATFKECAGLTSVTIPDSVTSIGRGAFAGCRSLTSIDIPDSVTSIGDGVFEGCRGLTSVTIPDSVISLGRRAFIGCSLASITIPDSITTFGSEAFKDGYNEIHTDVYTSNQLAIDYFLNIEYPPLHKIFHHSILGEYYVNYTEEIPDNYIMRSGNTGKSIVTLDYDTANLQVTVPTVLPVSVDSDNNVTVSDSAKIVNSSKGQVDVTNAVLSGNNTWTLAAFDTDFKKVPVNTKQYGFRLQGYSVTPEGNAYNNQFATIDGNSALDLSYDANVAIQSDATTDAEIGNIVFTVAWHK
jgi:hypothetical protein